MAISEDDQLEDLIDIFMPFDVETVLSSEFNPSREYDLNPILEELCKRTGQRRSVQCAYLTIKKDRDDRNYYCSMKIDVAVLGENSFQLRQLEKRLRQEVAMVYFILAESATVNETIDEKITSQVHWENKSEPNGHTEFMQMKRRIAWLTYELNRCQVRILELAHKSSGIQTGYYGSHVIVTNLMSVNQWAVPLFRPLPGDRKPSNINLQMFALVRDLIFNKTDVDQLAIRFQLAGRLDEGQWEQLRSSPRQFFLDMVRYMGLSGQQFIDACFKYDREGNLLAKPVRCPCGMDIDYYDAPYVHLCNFHKFVEDVCPSILYKCHYKCHDDNGHLIGPKETAYIVDVIKKRVPKRYLDEHFHPNLHKILELNLK